MSIRFLFLPLMWLIYFRKMIIHGMSLSWLIFLILVLFKIFLAFIFLIIVVWINGLGALLLQEPSRLNLLMIFLVAVFLLSLRMLGFPFGILKCELGLSIFLWKIAWDILPYKANISQFVAQVVAEVICTKYYIFRPLICYC
jgi:hypothetical protein